jgi:hypothetical protein
MLVVRVGIEAGGYISSDCLGDRRTTDGAGKSRASLSSEGPRLESSGNAMSPLLVRLGTDGTCSPTPLVKENGMC